MERAVVTQSDFQENVTILRKLEAHFTSYEESGAKLMFDVGNSNIRSNADLRKVNNVSESRPFSLAVLDEAKRTALFAEVRQLAKAADRYRTLLFDELKIKVGFSSFYFCLGRVVLIFSVGYR
jgi:hypothetical protein